MNGVSVIKRYARALFNAAKKTDTVSELKQDVLVLRKLFDEAPEIKDYCIAASAPDSKVTARILLESAFLPYLSSVSAEAVKVMDKNRRLEILPYLPEALAELFDGEEGITAVHVESAAELDDALRKKITTRLSDRIGAKIRIQWEVRPSLIGGMTFQWNNLFLDASLKGKFYNLKRQLKGMHNER